MKNKLKYLLISMFLVAVPSVFAAMDLGSSIINIANLLFGSVFIENFMGGAGFPIFSRFLIWLIIFALVYYVAHSRFGKNISIVLSTAIALMAVIPLKTELLKSLFQTYGVVAMGILFFVPIVGLFYITHSFFLDEHGNPNRLAYALRAVSFYILAALIHNIASTMSASMESLNFTSVQNTAETAVGICMLLVVWNVIRAIAFSPEGAAAGHTGLGDLLNRITQPTPPPAPAPPGTTPPGPPLRPGQPGYPMHLLAPIAEVRRFLADYQALSAQLLQLSRRICNNNYNRINMGIAYDPAHDLEEYRRIGTEMGQFAHYIHQRIDAVQNDPQYNLLGPNVINSFETGIVQWVRVFTAAAINARDFVRRYTANQRW